MPDRVCETIDGEVWRELYAGLVRAVVLCLPLVWSLAAIGREPQAPPDLSTVKDELRVLDASLAWFRLKSAESVTLPRTNIARRQFCELLRSTDRRAALTVDLQTDRSFDRVYDVREDGVRRFQLTYARNDPGEVSTLRITSQPSDALDFGAYTPYALTALMPMGKTVWRLLEDGGTLSSAKEAPNVRLDFTRDEIRLAATLCNKDWLPEVLTIESPKKRLKMHVSEFRNINGRWIPWAGDGEEEVFSGVYAGKTEFSFRALQVEINEPISDSEFKMPEVPAGVIVVDAINKRTHVVGGADARKKWERDHTQPEDRLMSRPMVANPPADATYWYSAGFAALALLLGAFGGWLQYRAQHR
jgi:hypothetical protein